MKSKSKSQKRMTETAAKELEKQELKHTSAQPTAPPIDVQPIEPTGTPIEIAIDPAEDEIDRIVREQQELLDARLKKEAEEKAAAEAPVTQKKFTFTALLSLKKYVKVYADTEEEALEKISELKVGDYINKKDVRFDMQKTN